MNLTNTPLPSDGAILDEIASYGLDVPTEDLRLCLKWANTVFCTGKMLPEERKSALELLKRLAAAKIARGGI